MRIPSDDNYDYVPVEPRTITEGADVLAALETSGQVVAIDTGPGWSYTLAGQNPDGSGNVGFALFPDDPESMPDEWWLRLRLWKRTDKLAKAGKVTATDGSKWIYPATGDGKMICYHPGTTFTLGQRLSRGEIYTDLRDLFIAGIDPIYDWMPVTDGSTVQIGDVLQFGIATVGVVDHIDYYDAMPIWARTSFFAADDEPLGWFDTLGSDAGEITGLHGTWTWFLRQPKPVDESLFSASDGSEWIYVDGAYSCWVSGTVYRAGSAFLRGDIAGSLIAT